MKELIILKPNNQKPMKQLKTETGAVVTEPVTVCLKLNEYFASVGKKGPNHFLLHI